MANDISLTGLTEILYQARDQVVAEPTGFSQSVTVNGGSEAVSAGGTVRSLRTTEPTLVTSYTPAMVAPDSADTATGVEEMTLSSYAGVDIPLKGEQFAQLANTVGADVALKQLYAQGIRKIRNQIEISIATAAYTGSSRGVGTAATTPFGANFEVLADLYKILEDNGTPMNDQMLSLIINTSAGANLRKRSTLTNVSDSGTEATLRRGELLNIFDFSIKSSAGVRTHTKGTGSGYLVNQTGLTTGSRAITTDTGTGTILAGDIITFASGAGSGHNYVVGTALASNVVTLNYPGLQGAIADNTAITVGNNYTANVAFHKSAIELAMRPVAQPPGGDIGEEIAVMVDEKTGLSFSARLYKGFGMNQIKLMCFYGVKVWKPEFVATLMG
jgi:hypothetical protein